MAGDRASQEGKKARERTHRGGAETPKARERSQSSRFLHIRWPGFGAETLPPGGKRAKRSQSCAKSAGFEDNINNEERADRESEWAVVSGGNDSAVLATLWTT